MSTLCINCGELYTLPGLHVCKPNYKELKAELSRSEDLRIEIRKEVAQLEAQLKAYEPTEHTQGNADPCHVCDRLYDEADNCPCFARKAYLSLIAQLKEKGEYGYSQFVVDALTKERDGLQEKLKAQKELLSQEHCKNGVLSQWLVEYKEKLKAQEWVSVECGNKPTRETSAEDATEYENYSVDVLLQGFDSEGEEITDIGWYDFSKNQWECGGDNIQSFDHWKPITLPAAKPESEKPATFLPACKWRHYRGTTIGMCEKLKCKFHFQPCSKRCTCPEPKRKHPDVTDGICDNCDEILEEH